jgi:hypothetical protein
MKRFNLLWIVVFLLASSAVTQAEDPVAGRAASEKGNEHSHSNSKDADDKLTVAVVTAGTSLIVTILATVLGFFSQKRLEREKVKLQAGLEAQKAELETLKGDITDRNSARAARRDYEYEARKRLYSEIEPLFLLLYAACEECYYRVKSLVPAFRWKGKLQLLV